MDGISRRTFFPGQTNRGKTKLSAESAVSRTRRRIADERRRRRERVSGNDIVREPSLSRGLRQTSLAGDSRLPRFASDGFFRAGRAREGSKDAAARADRPFGFVG